MFRVYGQLRNETGLFLCRRDVARRPFTSSTATVGGFDRIFTAVCTILGNPGAAVNKCIKNQRSHSRHKMSISDDTEKENLPCLFSFFRDIVLVKISSLSRVFLDVRVSGKEVQDPGS
jgi:hypothetical protein